MRVIAAYIYRTPELAEHRPLPGRSDEVLCFGNGYGDLRVEPGECSYDRIAAQLPPGWTPDVYVHWSLEYNPLPEGIEDAPCFTVGVVGDWNLGGQAVQLAAGAFDLLIADRGGCDRLRALGFENVAYAPQWGFDPLLHQPVPGVERDLDIVLAGNFNHDVQWERAPWLFRVARLSRRHRVCLTTGVYGEEYARLMSRARIVFNRSIRGELNMRAYEAAACGALLFYERTNREVEEVFADGESCVLYGDDDLEDLLDHYLADEEERRRIAEAGRAAVQRHAYPLQLARLMAVIEDAMERPAGRAWRALPAPERIRRRARQWMLVTDRRHLAEADPALLALHRALPGDASLAGDRACLLFEWGASTGDGAARAALWAQALQQADRAVALAPDRPVLRLNRAHILLSLGRLDEARAALMEAARQLEPPALRPDQVDGACIPRRFAAFDVAVEDVWIRHAHGSPDWTSAMARLLRWRAQSLMAEVDLACGRFLEALSHAREAVEIRPAHSATQHIFGRCLRACGRLDAAISALRKAYRAAPLETEIWVILAGLLADAGRTTECRGLLDELRAVVAGCPPCQHALPALEEIEARLAAPGERKRGFRVLALPDWVQTAQWENLVAEHCAVFHAGDPVELALRLDPASGADAAQIAYRIERLLERMGLAPEHAPDITLHAEPLCPEDQWRLFRDAGAFVDSGVPLHRALAEAAGVPIILPGSLAALRHRIRPQAA